jgi:hypothetical protein
MDHYPTLWRWIFPATALVSLSGTFLLLRLPLPKNQTTSIILPSLSDALIRPWKNFWTLLRERKDFAHFQGIFMLGGFGLMIMQPALPIFCVDTLQLTYTEVALAISACKGIGFALTSRLWAHWINKINLYLFNCIVTLFAALFPLFVIFSEINITWLYFAYLLYGIMQAGSELSWNLSGPIFAKEQESSFYTGVNVVLVGLRGCFGPMLGGLLCVAFHSTIPLIIGGISCLIGSAYGIYASRKFGRELGQELY